MALLDFNLTHLRYFYDAARLKSVGLAASRNFVTSSTVSQAIKKLEQNLNVKLLHHKKRDFRLTEEGQHLLEECEKIFLSIKNFENELLVSKKEPSGTLNFASSQSVVSAFLLQTIVDIQKKFPRVIPSLKLGKASYIKSLLANRETDLVITIDNGSFEKFETILLHTGHFILVESLKTKDSKHHLITESKPETEALQEHYKKEKEKGLMNFLVIDSWNLILQAVESGLGYGFIPDFVLNKQKDKNLRQVKGSFKYPYRLIVAHRKNETLSTTAKFLLESLRSKLRKR